jgi:hypothetical protein
MFDSSSDTVIPVLFARDSNGSSHRHRHLPIMRYAARNCPGATPGGKLDGDLKSIEMATPEAPSVSIYAWKRALSRG